MLICCLWCETFKWTAWTRRPTKYFCFTYYSW